MKFYIVTEDFLKTVIEDYADSSNIRDKADAITEGFLVDKAPVELVARGEGSSVTGMFINWHLNQDMNDSYAIYVQKININKPIIPDKADERLWCK